MESKARHMENRVENIPIAGKRERRTRAEQSAATAEAIMQAALICFNRAGSQATSIEDIAKEAGISRTLVHYHFKTKDDLFLQVQQHLFQTVSQRIQEAAANLGPSPAQAGWALAELWNMMKQARPFLPMFLDQVVRSLTNERLKAQFHDQIEVRRRMLADGIRSVLAMSGTEMDSRVPAVADLILASVTGLILVSLYADSLAPAEAAYQELKGLLRSLTATPATPGAPSPQTDRSYRV